MGYVVAILRTRNQEFPNLALKIITFSSEFSKELYIQGAGATQESRNVINSSTSAWSASGVGVCDHTEMVHTLATGISRLCIPSLLHTIRSLEPACSVSCDCSLTCWFSLSREECSRNLLAGLSWEPIAVQVWSKRHKRDVSVWPSLGGKCHYALRTVYMK